MRPADSLGRPLVTPSNEACRQLQVALTIFIVVAFMVPLDIDILDVLESPIFMLDMLVSFIFDVPLFAVSPERVTVWPT